MNTSSRFRILAQIIGYYFLLFVCQLAGELSVLYIMGGKPMDVWFMEGLGGEAELMQFLSEHAYTILLVTYGLLAAVLIIKKFVMKRHIVLEAGLESNFSLKYAFWGTVMGIGGSVWSGIMMNLLTKKTDALSVLMGSEAPETLQGTDNFLIRFIAVVIVASFFEELIFRGAIFSRLRLIIKPAGAVICQAIIFASMFGTLPAMIYSFIYAVILGLAVLKSGSLKSAVIIHMAVNCASLFASRYYDSIFAGKQITIAVMAVSGIVFAAAGYFYFKNNKASSVGEER